MSRERNIPIEALRFFIMLQICFWHFSSCYMHAGYIGVEFFFILSGIFLYRNATGKNNIGIINYTINKLKKFYLAYILALFFTYIISLHNLIQPFIANPIHEICRLIGQLLLIQNIGVLEGGLNGPLWFFSVLVYGGGIIYGLTKYYTNISIRVIFPIFTILFYSYAFGYQTGIGLEQWCVVGVFPIPFIRGMADIALGAMVGYLAYNYHSIISKYTAVLNILFLLAFCGYIAIIFKSADDVPYAIIFIIIILLTALNEKSVLHRIFKSSVWLKLGGLTFELYLIHFPLIRTVLFVGDKLSITSTQIAVLYSIVILPSAFIFKMIINYLQYHLSKHQSN